MTVANDRVTDSGQAVEQAERGAAAMWDALEGVVLRRVPVDGPLCLVCWGEGCPAGHATCPRRHCREVWQRFLSRRIGTRPPVIGSWP